MVALGETITVVNKSGKVVSTSKHLVNVFNEAKSAYFEKKAELKAQRDGTADAKRIKDGKSSPKHARPTLSQSSSRRSSYDRSHEPSRRSHHRSNRSPRDRSRDRSRDYSPDRRSGSQSPRSRRSPVDRDFGPRHENDRIRQIRRTQTMPLSSMEPTPAVIRRNSDTERANLQQMRNPSQTSLDDPNIDMDLAYGELPPPLPERPMDTETELKTKMTALNRMLEEANCVKYSAAAIIKTLEKNPDAMAAVALTLAEISNLAAKLGPGALMSMRTAFPAVIALLASPEFAIAIGVGVGLTVVALGGYKIIKRIKARGLDKSQVDELEEVNPDISHIEAWRRGIDFPDDISVGTSVEGEFVTPGASKQLEEEGLLEPKGKDGKGKKDKKDKSKDEDKKKKKHDKAKSDAGSRRSKSDDERPSKKEPSGLRMLFKRDK